MERKGRGLISSETEKTLIMRKEREVGEETRSCGDGELIFKLEYSHRSFAEKQLFMIIL